MWEQPQSEAALASSTRSLNQTQRLSVRELDLPDLAIVPGPIAIEKLTQHNAAPQLPQPASDAASRNLQSSKDVIVRRSTRSLGSSHVITFPGAGSQISSKASLFQRKSATHRNAKQMGSRT